MAFARTLTAGGRAVLGGDGGLLTAGAFAAVLALAASMGSGSHASNVAAGLGMAAAAVFGPLSAWRLHQRRVDGSATSGALLGYIAGVGIVWVILHAAWILASVLSALGTIVGLSVTKTAGATAVGIAVAVAYLAVAGWLDVDALRDLSPQRRRHAWLDIARLVATAVYAAYVVGVVFLVAGGPDSGAGMYTVLLLTLPGAVGAAIVTIADAMVRRDERRSRTPLISGV
jgi:hypothetical protein